MRILRICVSGSKRLPCANEPGVLRGTRQSQRNPTATREQAAPLLQPQKTWLRPGSSILGHPVGLFTVPGHRLTLAMMSHDACDATTVPGLDNHEVGHVRLYGGSRHAPHRSRPGVNQYPDPQTDPGCYGMLFALAGGNLCFGLGSHRSPAVHNYAARQRRSFCTLALSPVMSAKVWAAWLVYHANVQCSQVLKGVFVDIPPSKP